MHAPQTLALAIVLCAAVAHGAAPTTNYVNTWTYNPTAKTFDAGTTGTATTCVATEDQFPNKGVVSYANFKVTYHKTYKIVENKAANKKYLLHQRGCTKSTDATVTALKADTATFGGEFDIPLKSVKVASTTYFPFMEQIGERPAMRVYDSFTAGHGTTPCMQKQWADGWIKLKSASDAATVEATFGSGATGAGAIVMSDTAEPTFYGMSEWAEFMALWFNREQKVATLTDTVRSNWLQCKAENSKQLATATAKPKVLFVEYYFTSYPSSGTFKGWSVEPCHKCDDGSMPVLTNDFDGNGVWKCGVSGKGPTTLSGANRYCELIEAAGGQVMQNHVLRNSAVQANPTVPASGTVDPWPVGPWAGGGSMAGGLSGYNNAQLESVAKDVDIIIVKTGDCGCKWSTPACTAQQCSDKFRDEFQQMTGIPAVANKKVFDFYGTVDPKGGNAMLSGAGLSVDVLLQDFIKAISGDTSQTTKDHTYHFLRDNFAVGSWGERFACGAAGAPTIGCTPTAASIADKCTAANAIAADSLTAPKCKSYIEPAAASPAAATNSTVESSGSTLSPVVSSLLAAVMAVFALKSGTGY